jgi:hypothetical protein
VSWSVLLPDSAFRPPLYDSPVPTGFVDDPTGTGLQLGCFGAPDSSENLPTESTA